MKKRTKEILDILDSQFGTEYKCYLNYETPWQLLAATMLSAQCTDARVNIVTKDLFVKYPDMKAFAEADLKELEQDIKPTGFYHNKAKNIIEGLYSRFVNDIDLIPADARNNSRTDDNSIIAMDYIAGMSDPFAIARYEELFIPKFWVN